MLLWTFAGLEGSELVEYLGKVSDLVRQWL